MLMEQEYVSADQVTLEISVIRVSVPDSSMLLMLVAQVWYSQHASFYFIFMNTTEPSDAA